MALDIKHRWSMIGHFGRVVKARDCYILNLGFSESRPFGGVCSNHTGVEFPLPLLLSVIFAPSIWTAQMSD